MSDARLRPERIPRRKGRLRGKVRGVLICMLVLAVLCGAVLWLSRAIRARVAENIANQHSLGKSLFEDGKYEEAAAVLGELVKGARRSPQVEDALRKLGQIEEKAGKYELARTYWQRLAEEFSDHPSAHEATYHIGLLK